MHNLTRHHVRGFRDVVSVIADISAPLGARRGACGGLRQAVTWVASRSSAGAADREGGDIGI